MEPDYLTYTRQELVEAYKAIDREAYPERFNKIKSHLGLDHAHQGSLPDHIEHPIPERIEGKFQNFVLPGTLLFVVLFVMSLAGIKDVIESGVEDIRQLLYPAMIFMAPWGIWYVRRRYRKHGNDNIKFEKDNLIYQKTDTKYEIPWSEIKIAGLFRRRYLMAIFVESTSGEYFNLHLVHFNLRTSILKRFMCAKASEHGFKFVKKGWMGRTRDLVE